MISLIVYGSPEPAGSKRAVSWHAKDGRSGTNVIDANPKAVKWKSQVSQEAGKIMAGRELMDGPLEVEFTFVVCRPKGHYSKKGGLLPSAPTYPTTRPDVLKLARAVEDAMTGVVYRDDAQIAVETLRKQYGSPERVEISISPCAAAVIGPTRTGSRPAAAHQLGLDGVPIGGVS